MTAAPDMADRHPEWTPARLDRLRTLAQQDATYLATLHRPWRHRARLRPGQIARAVAEIAAVRRTRFPCPECDRPTVLTAAETLAKHGPDASPCPGSGSEVRW